MDEETGLYYYRARYYDAEVGRFISEDPIGFSGGDANLYRYVWNNSPNLIDPSGRVGTGFTFGSTLGGGNGRDRAGYIEGVGTAGLFWDSQYSLNTGAGVGITLAPGPFNEEDYVYGVIATGGPGFFLTGVDNIEELCKNIEKTATIGLPFLTVQLGLGRGSWKNWSLNVSGGSPFNFGFGFVTNGPSVSTPTIPLTPPLLPPG